MTKGKTPKNFKDVQAKSKATRYGGAKANPHRSLIEGAPVPYEVRKAYGALCRAPMDFNDEDPVAKMVTHLEKAQGGKLTGAQGVAAAIMRKALRGNLAAAEIVTVNNEGKLPDNVNINSSGVVLNANAPLEGEMKAAAVEEIMRIASRFKQPKEKN